jgi:hypothetical protein
MSKLKELTSAQEIHFNNLSTSLDKAEYLIQILSLNHIPQEEDLNLKQQLNEIELRDNIIDLYWNIKDHCSPYLFNNLNSYNLYEFLTKN